MDEVGRETSGDKCRVFHHDIMEDERLAKNIINEIHLHGGFQTIGELDILREKCSQGTTQDCCLVGNSWLLMMVLVTQHLLECRRCDKWLSVIITKFFNDQSKKIIHLISESSRNTQRYLQRKGLLLDGLVPLNIGTSQRTWIKKLIRAIIISFDKKSENNRKGNALTRPADIRTDILYSFHDNIQFHCFIYSSPSKADVHTVEIVGNLLTENNYSYVCANKFCPGESYIECLTHFVRNSQKIFVIVSSGFQNDSRCSIELKQLILPFCIEYENKIVPIVTDESELPDVLQAVIPVVMSDPNWKQKLMTSIEDVNAVTFPETHPADEVTHPMISYTARNRFLKYMQYIIITIVLCIKNSIHFIWLKLQGIYMYHFSGRRGFSVHTYRTYSTGDVEVIALIIAQINCLEPVLRNKQETHYAIGLGYCLVLLSVICCLMVKKYDRMEVHPIVLGALLTFHIVLDYHIVTKVYLKGASTILFVILFAICIWKTGLFCWIIQAIQNGIRMLKESYNNLKTEVDDVIDSTWPMTHVSLPEKASNVSQQLHMAFIYVQYNHESQSLTWIPVSQSGVGMYRITSTLLTPENSLHFHINVDDQCRSSMPMFSNPARISKITELIV